MSEKEKKPDGMYIHTLSIKRLRRDLARIIQRAIS